MSHELPLPPWVPADLVVQTFLQKDVVLRYGYELPPSASLAPDTQRSLYYTATATTWKQE